jgi:hypothetical protein
VRRLCPILLALLLGGCESAQGPAAMSQVDQGYLLGAADTVKQLYWAKQALEAPRENVPSGRTEYYTWEESGTAVDGRKLAPEKVAVPVFVPAPVPSGAQIP